MSFTNVYDDAERAEAYAKLDFPGTYYLAFRDLPKIIGNHVQGSKALDFGCGAGRSTRFLKEIGFNVIGVDISEDMLRLARERDPQGEYVHADETTLNQLGTHAFDLVQSIFTFDNIPTHEKKVEIFKALAGLLRPEGCIINLVSSPDIYTHEWASFSTKDFAGNLVAKTGDSVFTMMLDVEDRRPVHDILWPDLAYRAVFEDARLEIVKIYKPLGKPEESFKWVNETNFAPWVIYVLQAKR
jgi:ubiquinone/menaquinone biosynthesis C-methylase UbiE